MSTKKVITGFFIIIIFKSEFFCSVVGGGTVAVVAQSFYSSFFSDRWAGMSSLPFTSAEMTNGRQEEGLSLCSSAGSHGIDHHGSQAPP